MSQADDFSAVDWNQSGRMTSIDPSRQQEAVNQCIPQEPAKHSLMTCRAAGPFITSRFRDFSKFPSRRMTRLTRMRICQRSGLEIAQPLMPAQSDSRTSSHSSPGTTVDTRLSTAEFRQGLTLDARFASGGRGEIEQLDLRETLCVAGLYTIRSWRPLGARSCDPTKPGGSPHHVSGATEQ